MKYFGIGKILLGLGVMAMSCSFLYAVPNGKPFVELQGQIVEVQGQIATLEERIDDVLLSVTNLEERVTTVEGNVATINAAIERVNANNEVLLIQLVAVLDTATANNEDIQNALAAINSLQSQINDLMGSSEVNAEAIANLQLQIDEQQVFIAANAEGYQALLTQIDDNHDLIQGLTDKIATFDDQLALKQSIINTECAEGMVLSKINADGSYECVLMNSNTNTELASLGLTYTTVIGGGEIGGTIGRTEYYTAYRTECLTTCNFLNQCQTNCQLVPYIASRTIYDPKTSSYVQLTCPKGTLWTYESGYTLPDGVTFTGKGLNYNDQEGTYTWTFHVSDPEATVQYMSVSAQCIHAKDISITQ